MPNLQALADELIEHERATAKPPAATVWSNGMRRRRRHRVISAGVVGLGAIGLVVGLAAVGRNGSTVSVSAQAGQSPGSLPVTMDSALGDPPSIPQEWFTRIRDANNAAADCMSRYGFDGMPRLPDTYGDGKTPAQNLDLRSDTAETQFRAALPHCTNEIEVLRRANLESQGLPYEPIPGDTTVQSQTTTQVGQPNDPSAWLATCLTQGRMLVTPPDPMYQPAHSAAEVITKLKDDGANLAPDATAYLVTVSDDLDGGGQPLPSSPQLDTDPMWVVVTPTGSNKISDTSQGGPDNPHTSPLDGQPVFVYWVVSDKTGQTFLATQCAMTAPKP